MMLRGSSLAAAVTGVLLVLAVAAMMHAAMMAHAGRERRAATHALAAQLGLTDMALFTEARYTRHRSLADLHSAFQDAPMAMEHFPAGSLVMPPRDFRKAGMRTGTGD
jgi:hypothetical protein